MPPLAVFDFDQTLAAAEVSPWIDRAGMQDRGFGGAERVRMLRDMLTELTVTHGVTCAVCSLNCKDVIRPALQTVELLGFFGSASPQIYDGDAFEAHGNSKSRVIAEAIIPAVGPGTQDVLFADDDPAHIKDVRLHLQGRNELRVHTVLVPRVGSFSSVPRVTHLPSDALMSKSLAQMSLLPAGGMREAHCAEALQWARDAAARVACVGRAAESAAPSSETATADAHAPCTQFVPKRHVGPLARRCAACGAHQSDHGPEGDPGAMV